MTTEQTTKQPILDSLIKIEAFESVIRTSKYPLQAKKIAKEGRLLARGELLSMALTTPTSSEQKVAKDLAREAHNRIEDARYVGSDIAPAYTIVRPDLQKFLTQINCHPIKIF